MPTAAKESKETDVIGTEETGPFIILKDFRIPVRRQILTFRRGETVSDGICIRDVKHAFGDQHPPWRALNMRDVTDGALL